MCCYFPKQYFNMLPHIPIQEDEEDETSTVYLQEETSEVSHELEYIYFGESDDDGGDNFV